MDVVGLVIFVLCLPALSILAWIGWMIERRRFELRELFLLVAYVAFIIILYWKLLPALYEWLDAEP